MWTATAVLPVTAAGLLAGATMNYVIGPVVAAVVMALLALVTRWAFGSGRSVRKPAVTEDGLLVKVATLSRRELAVALQAALAGAGIRSTLRERVPGRTVVLVFPEDAARARQIAATFPLPE